MSESGPHLIGWKEWLAFPDWGVTGVRVKIDTGALTSALGVLACDLRPGPDGGTFAELLLGFSRKHPERRVRVTAAVLRTVRVRNSGGTTEERPVVETRVRLGPVEKSVRLTVTRRCHMHYPMLLGRRALAGDFLVDVARADVLRKG